MSGTNGRITSARNKPNSKLDEDEDDEWLFESIVTYLSSPIWSTPIQHFIEKYCPCKLIFISKNNLEIENLTVFFSV
jgi:hypothetical protein